MRVFRDLDMVEQMGSGITRILQAYPKTIYRFTNNFIRITMPFAQGFMESQEQIVEKAVGKQNYVRNLISHLRERNEQVRFPE